MIQAIGIAHIQHFDTGKIYEIYGDFINFESKEIDDRDRGMGIEIEHTAIFYHEELGELIWTIWEYPVGETQKPIHSIGSHKLLEDFKFKLSDDYSIHDDYSIRLDKMVGWFHKNYEDPANSIRHNSTEIDYEEKLYDAGTVLAEKFSDDINGIDAVVEHLEANGIFEWSRIYPPKNPLQKELFPDDSLEDINERLNTLIDNAPAPTTAPAFALGDDGIFYITKPPDSQPFDNQNNSPKGLRTTIDKLLELLKKGNVHRDLIPITEDYKKVILGDKISISDLHCHGLILGNMAHAIENGIDKKEEPPLSLKTKTYLNSALDLHHTYMMLDEKGQRLMNATNYRKSAEQIEGLKDAIGQLSNTITESRDLLDAGSRRYISNALKGIGQGNHPERSNQSIGNILTNLVSDILGWIKRNSTQTITDLVINKVIEGALGLDSIAIGTVAINGALLLVSIAPLLLIVVAPFAGELSWLASAAHLLERIRLKIKSD